MSHYVLVAVAALLVNSIPVFAPPTWTVLVGLLLAYELNPWMVALLGVVGATTGRLILGMYLPWVADRVLDPQSNENMSYLGSKLSGRPRSTMLFIFVYSLTPLSTSSLFTATAVARTKQAVVLPPFFAGKLISYLVLVWTAEYLSGGAGDLLAATFSWRGLIGAGLGAALLIAALAVDWRALLERGEFRWALSFRRRLP